MVTLLLSFELIRPNFSDYADPFELDWPVEQGGISAPAVNQMISVEATLT